jgi:hypothetical protein
VSHNGQLWPRTTAARLLETELLLDASSDDTLRELVESDARWNGRAGTVEELSSDVDFSSDSEESVDVTDPDDSDCATPEICTTELEWVSVPHASGSARTSGANLRGEEGGWNK